MISIKHLAKLTTFAKGPFEKVWFTIPNWDISPTRSYVQLVVVRVDNL